MKFRPCRDTFFNIYFRCPITHAISSITAGSHRIPSGKIPLLTYALFSRLPGHVFGYLFLSGSRHVVAPRTLCWRPVLATHSQISSFPICGPLAATRVPEANEEIMGFQSRPPPALHHLLPTRHPQIQTLPAVCPGTSKPARMTADATV
jgi:hypothetical protein